MKVKRLPIAVNFKDTYKSIFFIFLIAVILFASSFLEKYASGAVYGGIFALCVQWWMTMISMVQISGRNSILEIEEIVKRAGYIDIADGLYRHRFPRFLRFDSQLIHVSRSVSGASVVGPYYMLRHMNILLNNPSS